jgi:predicted ribosomally synthesized peptide with nif11-like leader
MNHDLEMKFVKQLGKDKKLQDALSKAKTPEQAHKVVVAAGYDVKLGEFKTSMAKLNSALNPKAGQLSENDLEMVAGGRASEESILSYITTGAAVVGAGAAAAA